MLLLQSTWARKVDCDLFKRHKAEKEATRGSGEGISAPVVNTVLIIECDDTERQQDIKKPSQKSEEVPTKVVVEEK